ncbi:pseudouridine synthase [Lacrimispora celerecrescens]|uniref:Pseudouridine synthase n=1 Tax=[Clostridium] celerecrescens 18A TaxID=1286362 RepID=A0A2M8Z426_9FIRM|nr:pseudouridine synthase [Lacrimispora celerecrescens]PJJ28199.1 16S rRNA pseudouridine516 synthase [[Clostridium] celerecrescens 18A]
MKELRLDKYLTEMGEGTRSQIKEMARKGRILVDGIPEKRAERKIDPEQQQVSVDGRPVSYVRYEYYMLNKPQGVVSATEDSRYETVISLIEERKRDDLFPVGRLDIDTEGLLLITNDGDLAHRLLSPKKHVDKVYFARVEGELPPDAKERMEEGLVLSDGTPTMPALLEVLKQGKNKVPSEIHLTIREGKFHQVKRMFETLGCCVIYLKRMSMGSLILDEALKPGEYRPLSEDEILSLKNHGK